jgi:hypothetical protein
VNAYATSAQLLTYTGLTTAPADAGRLLLRASELIDSIVRAAYTVDINGIPTDADKAEALAKATCFVVEQWLEVGEANDIDGLAGSAASVGSYSGKRAPAEMPRALRVLREAGLMGSA